MNHDENQTALPTNSSDLPNEAALDALAREVKTLARDLGFTDVGIAGVDLPEDEARLLAWLEAGHHGSLHYMERFGAQRARPAELKPGTLRVISVRLDYYPSTAADPGEVLEDATLGYVSRYALGRDYHRLMRNRLQDLAEALTAKLGAFGHRVFVDSGPVMEKPLARNAGLGWIGKHTNLLSREAGSWFFLGELFVALALPVDSAPEDHCGSCTACLHACPTGAIIAPYQLDARRCLSYLTIENEGSIPEEFRTALGNRTNTHASRARPPSNPGMGLMPRAWWTCLRGPKSSFWNAWPAAPSGASATNAGCAISPWLWGMHRPQPLWCRPCKHGAARQRRCCRSISTGRSAATQRLERISRA